MASTGMRLGALHIDEEGRPGIRVRRPQVI